MRTFIVAEIGTNFINDLHKAESLVCDAALAGADAVKTQLYNAETLAAHEAPLYWKGAERSQREAFAKLDKLSIENHQRLFEYADYLGLMAYSTPFDLVSVDVLQSFGVRIFKIASADITFHQLLTRVAETGRPVQLSTGASTMNEVSEALGVLLEAGATDITLLGCTLTYPCPDEDANLSQLVDLADFGFRVGYSDHTLSIMVPALAVAMGAQVIEKHLGNPTFEGADNSWALGRDRFREMVDLIRSTESAVGDLGKVVLPSEEPARENARRSLATKRDVWAGEFVDEDTVTSLRPGSGIPAREFFLHKGRMFLESVPSGTLVRKDQLR